MTLYEMRTISLLGLLMLPGFGCDSAESGAVQQVSLAVERPELVSCTDTRWSTTVRSVRTFCSLLFGRPTTRLSPWFSAWLS
jgi:hypothetical protein